MPFEVACAAIEKYAAERDDRGVRLLREVVPSTMGEPLLYSEFDRLLKFCRTLDIPMNLTTNGSFPGKWGSEAGLKELLLACSDIKVSTLSAECGGLDLETWRANVLKLLECRRSLLKSGVTEATVSLQATIHRENIHEVEKLLRWAENAGVQRIKWNPVVFLSLAPKALVERFSVSKTELENLRKVLCSDKLRCEGSLFFDEAAGLCPVGGVCGKNCPFADEVWVWPDGHEDHCPNPEYRFGRPLEKS